MVFIKITIIYNYEWTSILYVMNILEFVFEIVVVNVEQSWEKTINHRQYY